MLQQLLHNETVCVGLEAKTPDEAIEKMILQLPEWVMAPKQSKVATQSLLSREKFGTTAIGGGVALPHCVTDVSVPIASLGISREGVAFPSLDGDPVHFIYMVLAPENEETHRVLRSALHEAEKIFKDSFLKQRLKLSETPEEAYEILLRESKYLIPNLQAV